MTLIESICGIRGTIGGNPNLNFTPIDIVLYTSAFATWLKSTVKSEIFKVVVGRDARMSGYMVHSLVNQTLVGLASKFFKAAFKALK